MTEPPDNSYPYDPIAVECDGWWEQTWLGWQPMHGLRLVFDGGTIKGSGSDIIGAFSLTGVLGDGGAVAIKKQYVKQHSVEYLGVSDGEGMLTGEWRIGAQSGPWRIRIRGTGSNSPEAIQEYHPK